MSSLDYLTNGFFVETDPGFASLDLAKALAGQVGVELSSPNWRRRTHRQVTSLGLHPCLRQDP